MKEEQLPTKLSEHPLFLHAGLEIVWQQDTSSSRSLSRQYVGSLTHSSRLVSAIEGGLLDSFFGELTQTYRDIYGGPPWSEYVICERQDCAKTSSIADIHLNQKYIALDILEKSMRRSPQDISCTNCGAPLEFFYSPEELFDQVRGAFLGKIAAAFLFDSSAQLIGFSLGLETTVKQGWADKIILGHGDKQRPALLPYSVYIAEARRYIESDLCEESRAFNSAEWAVAIPGRKSGASLPLYYANIISALKAMSEYSEDFPVIGHSLLGSRALEIFCMIGFKYGQRIAGSDHVRVYSTLRKLLEGISRLCERREQ